MRQICEGDGLDHLELPWTWGPWWRNVLRMGREVGRPFGEALNAAGELSTRQRTSLELDDGGCESETGVGALACLLEANTTLTRLSLRGCGLEPWAASVPSPAINPLPGPGQQPARRRTRKLGGSRGTDQQTAPSDEQTRRRAGGGTGGAARQAIGRVGGVYAAASARR